VTLFTFFLLLLLYLCLSSESIGSSSDKKTLSDGTIAGIAIGGFFGLVLIAGLIYYFACFSLNPADKAPLVSSAQNKV